MQSHKSIFFAITMLICNTSFSDCIKDKYIFDVGSGGIDSVGYIIDTCAKKVKKIKAQSYYNLPLQHCISTSHDKQSLSNECIEDAKLAFESLQKKFNINCKKDKCIAVATAWARNAKNAQTLIDRIKEYGIKVSVLSQHDEGKISFHSLMLENNVIGDAEKKAVVFDIGGGSFQLNTLDDNGEIHVYKGPYGMFNFKPLVMKKFGNGKNDILDPKDLKAIKKFALDEIGSKLKKDKILMKKFSSKDIKVFGAGSFMSKGTVQLDMETVFSIDDIEKTLESLVGKTVPEIQSIYTKMPKEYAPNQQFSLFIIYAIMKKCGIDRVYISPHGGINQYIALNGVPD
jgi:exopolyphosphatase/pppGpp-phosphohydrolase